MAGVAPPGTGLDTDLSAMLVRDPKGAASLLTLVREYQEAQRAKYEQAAQAVARGNHTKVTHMTLYLASADTAGAIADSIERHTK